MKAIVLGGTKGIGKSIAHNLKKHCSNIVAAGRQDINTTSIESVKNFAKKHTDTDILVLNTGGPPDLKIEEIDDIIWLENFIISVFTSLKLFLFAFLTISPANMKKSCLLIK